MDTGTPPFRGASMDATLRPYFVRDPFEVSAGAPIVQAARRALPCAKIVGDTPWMDAALLAAAGIETVVLGPSGAGAHAAEEWVDVKSVEQLAKLLYAIALDYCA